MQKLDVNDNMEEEIRREERRFANEARAAFKRLIQEDMKDDDRKPRRRNKSDRRRERNTMYSKLMGR